MAGNGKSGRNPVFHLSEKQLEEKITQYWEDLENGKFARASSPHFLSYIGCLEREAKEFIEAYSMEPKSAYYGRARMLEGVLQAVRGEIFSSHGWGGQQSSLARVHLKKDYGDGVVYTDKDNEQNGPVEIKISFGGDDPRAKDAAK